MPENEIREKLIELLTTIFQFDTTVLDFGKYKILNYKKKEIEKFIKTDLVDEINQQLKLVGKEEREKLENELKELEQKLKEEFEEGWEKSKSYQEKKNQLKNFKSSENIEKNIFNHIFTFFSRYYDKGDFINQRKYGSDKKYLVPYNGEEVLLHWATDNEYYIKTTEMFTNYSFWISKLRVNFTVTKTEEEDGNVKSLNDKFFIVAIKNVFTFKKNQLDIYFEYRSLTTEETKEFSTKPNQDKMHKQNFEKIKEVLGNTGGTQVLFEDKNGKTPLRENLIKFTERNKSDYFIHKNLKGFLETELDFYIKNDVMNISDVQSLDASYFEKFALEIKVLKVICIKIIEFLSQIENFQKKLWEKKKFVQKTDYCITLDYIDEEYFPEILKNKEQLQEWAKLYNFDIKEEIKKLKTTQTKEKNKEFEILKQNPTLMIDTKFYDVEFKLKLVESIQISDEKINGLLINSENFQALNLLMEKYRGKIKCCYVDPPYNTGKDEFLYKDNYQHSSWLSLMDDRLRLGRELLEPKGNMFVSIADHEFHELRIIMNKIFQNDNFKSTFIWKNEGKTDNQFEVKKNHEYILCYGNSNKSSLGYVIDPNTPQNSNVWKGLVDQSSTKNHEKNPASEITLPIGFPCLEESLELEPTTILNSKLFYNEVSSQNHISRDMKKKYCIDSYPIRKDKLIVKNSILTSTCKLFSGWANANKIKDFIDKECKVLDDNGEQLSFFLTKEGVIKYKKITGENTRNVVSILEKFGTTEQMKMELERMGLVFSFPKPKSLIEYIVKLGGCKDGDYVCDFFAGSGTTGQSVISLNKKDKENRKYILVEMGKHFENVLKPRMQKIIFRDDWNKEIKKETNGSPKHIIKYHDVEQFDDTLENIEFSEKKIEGIKDYFVKL